MLNYFIIHSNCSNLHRVKYKTGQYPAMNLSFGGNNVKCGVGGAGQFVNSGTVKVPNKTN